MCFEREKKKKKKEKKISSIKHVSSLVSWCLCVLMVTCAVCHICCDPHIYAGEPMCVIVSYQAADLPLAVLLGAVQLLLVLMVCRSELSCSCLTRLLSRCQRLLRAPLCCSQFLELLLEATSLYLPAPPGLLHLCQQGTPHLRSINSRVPSFPV